MKTSKIKIIVIIAFLVLALPSLSFAGGNSGAQVIQQVKIGQGGTIQIWGDTGDWNNPDSCNSSKFILLLPSVGSVENLYYSEMYAFVVAGYLQSLSISGFLGGCSEVNGLTYPILRNVQSTK